MSRHRLDDRNYFLGAVGIRSDGTSVIAWNGNPKFPTRQHHCEYRLGRKLSKGSVAYIARTLADGTWANAKPCNDCEKYLMSRGVVRVYYTLGPSEFGCIVL